MKAWNVFSSTLILGMTLLSSLGLAASLENAQKLRFKLDVKKAQDEICSTVAPVVKHKLGNFTGDNGVTIPQEIDSEEAHEACVDGVLYAAAAALNFDPTTSRVQYLAGCMNYYEQFQIDGCTKGGDAYLKDSNYQKNLAELTRGSSGNQWKPNMNDIFLQGALYLNDAEFHDLKATVKPAG